MCQQNFVDMTGYTKLFGSIVASTIWREDNDTRIVWITMLALANKDGVVEASIPGLADLSRVTVEACRAAIVKLEAPDPDSRTKEYDGRRISPIDGGWSVLNHAKYRAKMSADQRREYFRIKQAEHRANVKGVSTLVNKCQSSYILSTQAEAKAKASDQTDHSTLDAPRPDRATGTFQQPTPEELDLYAAKLALPSTEVAKFVDHYESNGWKVGKNPMRSWQAAMRNWNVNFRTGTYGNNRTNNQPDRNAGIVGYEPGRAARIHAERKAAAAAAAKAAGDDLAAQVAKP